MVKIFSGAKVGIILLQMQLMLGFLRNNGIPIRPILVLGANSVVIIHRLFGVNPLK